MIKLDLEFKYAHPWQFKLHAKQGEKIAIVGASGAGKSTLLNLIAGFVTADTGILQLKGENHLHTSPAQRPLSMLFQQHNLFEHLTVRHNLCFGIKPSFNLTLQEEKCLQDMANAIELGEYLDKLPAEISGGQQQRVALGRCLLRKQPILLLDEPFSALDMDLRQSMAKLTMQMCTEQNLTLLMVTHHLNEVENYVDTVYKIKDFQLVKL